MSIAFGSGFSFRQGAAQVLQSDAGVFQPPSQAQVWPAPLFGSLAGGAVHVPWPLQFDAGRESQPVAWLQVLPLPAADQPSLQEHVYDAPVATQVPCPQSGWLSQPVEWLHVTPVYPLWQSQLCAPPLATQVPWPQSALSQPVAPSQWAPR